MATVINVLFTIIMFDVRCTIFDVQCVRMSDLCSFCSCSLRQGNRVFVIPSTKGERNSFLFFNYGGWYVCSTTMILLSVGEAGCGAFVFNAMISMDDLVSICVSITQHESALYSMIQIAGESRIVFDFYEVRVVPASFFV